MTDGRMNMREALDAAKEIKLIVTDIDGTILRTDKTVSSYTKSVLAALRERGFIITVCTGRNLETLEPFMDMLGIERYVIACNGAEVADAAGGVILSKICLPAEMVKSFMRFCVSLNIECSVSCAEEAWYFRGDVSRERRLLRDRWHDGDAASDVRIVSDGDISLGGRQITKAVAQCYDDVTANALKQFAADNPQIEIISTDVHFYEMLLKGIDKGYGVKTLAEHLGLCANNCCTFGDYDNDIPMLEYARIGVAMGNASGEVKSHADLIAGSNDEDGAAHMMARLFLGE